VLKMVSDINDQKRFEPTALLTSSVPLSADG
jgi:hypothetical protein